MQTHTAGCRQTRIHSTAIIGGDPTSDTTSFQICSRQRCAFAAAENVDDYSFCFIRLIVRAGVRSHLKDNIISIIKIVKSSLVIPVNQAPSGATSSSNAEYATPDGVLFCFGFMFYKDAAPTALAAFLDVLAKYSIEINVSANQCACQSWRIRGRHQEFPSPSDSLRREESPDGWISLRTTAARYDR